MNFSKLAILLFIISSCGLKTKPRPKKEIKLKPIDQKYIDLYRSNNKDNLKKTNE